MKFNIVESSSTEMFDELYDKIKHDLINGFLVKDIRAKYDINQGSWLKWRKIFIKEGFIKSTDEKQSNAKFYYYNKTSKSYYVVRTINHKKTHFMCCSTEEDAKFVVSKLNEYGWDKSNLPKIREELNVLKRK